MAKANRASFSRLALRLSPLSVSDLAMPTLASSRQRCIIADNGPALCGQGGVCILRVSLNTSP